ncbi:hypothetical protein BpHYR1_041153 [Brachionus plicatilis]|uniref:RNA-directed DNA polymerase from mobile element jockey-like n=1 Tax=Brachionus plicatilis TaxID=10195 RepID=A0A3M7RSR1_BRAPC|nr:hypothetical protein BpHYR1_041153 [Brachionus plicatilis]
MSPKILGIKFDTGLTFREHFKEILSSKCYAINSKYLMTIYKATVLSQIQYSMLPFIKSPKKSKNELQIVQNRAIRTIFKINRSTP